MRLFLFLAAWTLVGLMDSPCLAQEPAWFYDGAHRYLKLTHEGVDRILIEVRTVGQPGEVSRWNADGNKEEKDYLFARSVGENESRGSYFIGIGGEASFRVKLRPARDKEEKVQDEGVVGMYHRITEERRLGLAKHEAEGAEKRLAETIKAQGKKWAAADKPALSEWRTRWPGLRDRELALHEKPKAMNTAPSKPALGVSGGGNGAGADVPEKRPERWFEWSELAQMGIGFVSGEVNSKTKDGWDGEFNDGFGGTVQVELNGKDGLVHFTLNYARGNDEQNGMLTGKTVARNDGGESYADFVERDPKVEDPTKQTHVRLHLVGHYLIVDTQNIGKYTTRGWFEGVYRKQPPPEQ